MDAVPGRSSAVLSDANVGQLRTDERLFEAVLQGWRTHMGARRTIQNAGDVVAGHRPRNIPNPSVLGGNR